MRRVRVFASQFVAVTVAAAISARFRPLLVRSTAEWGRYCRKSCNLALCYVDFGVPGNLKHAWAAGLAGFICCAYDVVTDWRNFDSREWQKLRWVMRWLDLKPSLVAHVAELYQHEHENTIGEDGLDRGIYALEFILELMGISEARMSEWGRLTKIGLLLQLIDDILYYEDDIRRNEMNCLTNNRREEYLYRLLERTWGSVAWWQFVDQTPILGRVVCAAEKKANRLLEMWERED